MDAELEELFADAKAAAVKAARAQYAYETAKVAVLLAGFFLTALLFAEWLRYPETAVLTMIFGG